MYNEDEENIFFPYFYLLKIQSIMRCLSTKLSWYHREKLPVHSSYLLCLSTKLSWYHNSQILGPTSVSCLFLKMADIPFTQPQNHLQITPLFPHSHPISLKFSSGDNFLMWLHQQVLATVQGYGLEPFLDGSVPILPQLNPDAPTSSVQPNLAFLA